MGRDAALCVADVQIMLLTKDFEPHMKSDMPVATFAYRTTGPVLSNGTSILKARAAHCCQSNAESNDMADCHALFMKARASLLTLRSGFRMTVYLGELTCSLNTTTFTPNQCCRAELQVPPLVHRAHSHRARPRPCDWKTAHAATSMIKQALGECVAATGLHVREDRPRNPSCALRNSRRVSLQPQSKPQSLLRPSVFNSLTMPNTHASVACWNAHAF